MPQILIVYDTALALRTHLDPLMKRKLILPGIEQDDPDTQPIAQTSLKNYRVTSKMWPFHQEYMYYFL